MASQISLKGNHSLISQDFDDTQKSDTDVDVARLDQEQIGEEFPQWYEIEDLVRVVDSFLSKRDFQNFSLVNRAIALINKTDKNLWFFRLVRDIFQVSVFPSLFVYADLEQFEKFSKTRKEHFREIYQKLNTKQIKKCYLENTPGTILHSLKLSYDSGRKVGKRLNENIYKYWQKVGVNLGLVLTVASTIFFGMNLTNLGFQKFINEKDCPDGLQFDSHCINIYNVFLVEQLFNIAQLAFGFFKLKKNNFFSLLFFHFVILRLGGLLHWAFCAQIFQEGSDNKIIKNIASTQGIIFSNYFLNTTLFLSSYSFFNILFVESKSFKKLQNKTEQFALKIFGNLFKTAKEVSIKVKNSVKDHFRGACVKK